MACCAFPLTVKSSTAAAVLEEVGILGSGSVDAGTPVIGQFEAGW